MKRNLLFVTALTFLLACDTYGMSEKELIGQDKFMIKETTPEIVYLGEFELTAYCKCTKCCGKWSDSPCKNGENPVADYTIAVDPKVIPLNSFVEIEGVKYKAMDTGSAIKGNIIDVYFDKHSDALDFGRKKKIKVYIYKER